MACQQLQVADTHRRQPTRAHLLQLLLLLLLLLLLQSKLICQAVKVGRL